MEINLLQQVRRLFNRENARLNLRLAVFTFFLVITTVLWYLNKLSNEHTADIAFPIRYSGMPRGQVMVGEAPGSITLRITSYGYTLLRHKASARLRPITIDLSHMTQASSNGQNSEKFFLITSRLRSSVAHQFGSDFRLETISPDTLHFEFAPIVERRVPVSTNLIPAFDRQYMQSGPLVVNPDSITISGPRSIVDTIYEVQTLPLKVDRLNQPLSRSLPLVSIRQVGFSHRRVEIELPVEKYTQASLSIPVGVKNLPDSLKLILLPQWIVLKCNVPVNRYNALTSKNFQASVDFNSIHRTIGGSLRVLINKKPPYIQNISFEPQYLDYIIEQR